MKILVLSDSHGKSEIMVDIFRKGAYKAVIFLGDNIRDSERLYNVSSAIPVYRVKGNCDFYEITPEELIIELNSKRILICHGHKYGVKSGYTNFKYRALECQCQIALCGHTHQQFKHYADNLLIANPGSIAAGKYGVLTIGKQIDFELRDINDD